MRHGGGIIREGNACRKEARMERMGRLGAVLAWVLGSAVSVSGADGYLLEYETAGWHAGGTKVEGNLAFLFKSGAKKLSGATVYYERGNPYPNIEERAVIFDLAGGKKHSMAADTGRWTTTELAGETALLPDQKVKVDYTRTPDRAVLRFDVQLPEVMGGASTYTVTYLYGKDAGKEAARMRSIRDPAPVDAVLFFLDNRRFAELAARKMGEDRFQVPERFQVVCERGGQKAFEISGRLRAVQPLNLSDRDFQVR